MVADATINDSAWYLLLMCVSNNKIGKTFDLYSLPNDGSVFQAMQRLKKKFRAQRDEGLRGVASQLGANQDAVGNRESRSDDWKDGEDQ
jgi:hypothetical protein